MTELGNTKIGSGILDPGCSKIPQLIDILQFAILLVIRNLCVNKRLAKSLLCHNSWKRLVWKYFFIINLQSFLLFLSSLRFYLYLLQLEGLQVVAAEIINIRKYFCQDLGRHRPACQILQLGLTISGIRGKERRRERKDQLIY